MKKPKQSEYPNRDRWLDTFDSDSSPEDIKKYRELLKDPEWVKNQDPRELQAKDICLSARGK